LKISNNYLITSQKIGHTSLQNLISIYKQKINIQDLLH
jgi:hypothetical protein